MRIAAVAGALELRDQEFERFRLTVNDESPGVSRVCGVINRLGQRRSMRPL